MASPLIQPHGSRPQTDLLAFFSKTRRGERGAALVISLIMLVFMSILGAVALNTSNSELGISGNYRLSQSSFYAADRAVEYIMRNNTILYSSPGDVFDLNQSPYKDDLNAGGTRLHDRSVNEVRNTGVGQPPRRLTQFTTGSYGAVYYRLMVTGAGPNDRSLTRVDSMQVRIFKSSDHAGDGGEG